MRTTGFLTAFWALAKPYWVSERRTKGLLILAAGVIPLLLYVAFGPKDGNPIGLGLLFIVATTILLKLLCQNPTRIDSVCESFHSFLRIKVIPAVLNSILDLLRCPTAVVVPFSPRR